MNLLDASSPPQATLPVEGLVNVSRVPPLRQYLRDIWDRRDYLRAVPLAELRAQHYDTVLGNVWHVVTPLLLIGVYFLVFGLGLRSNRGIDNFLTFLAVGVFLFHYTQRSTIQGAKAIVSNQGLIRSIRFPRMILPLSVVIGEMLAFLPAFVVMAALVLVTGETPGLSWFALPAVFALQTLLNFGAASISARITDVVRDFANVLPFVMRIVFYGSGILYSVEQRVENDLFRFFFEVNPVYAVITLARQAIFGEPFTMVLWLTASLWAVALATAGFFFFKAGEQTYGRA